MSTSAIDGYLNTPLRPEKELPPFIDEGEHLLDLVDLYETPDAKTKAPIVWAKFRVEESTKHTVGTKVARRFDITKREKYADNATQVELLVYMVAALIGTKDLQLAKQKLSAILKHPGKPARGMRVQANGRARTSGTGKRFVNVAFQHVDQTKEEIAQRRTVIDMQESVEAAAQPAPAAPPPPVAPAPAPQGGSSINLDDILG